MAKKQPPTPEELAAKELADRELGEAIAMAERQDRALAFAADTRLIAKILHHYYADTAIARFLMAKALGFARNSVEVSEDPELQEMLAQVEKNWEAIASRLPEDPYLDLDQYLPHDRSKVSRPNF